MRPRPLIVPILLAMACSDGVAPLADPIFRPDAALGRVAFETECALCHATRDGFDLAFFNFSDTTIVRRAVAHVDTATALHIVAHIRSLATPQGHRDLQLFQPGGGMATSDVDFVLRLFGADAWPATLSTAQLRAVDPRQVRIAVDLPVWSDEGSNRDWMPDRSLSQEIRSFSGDMVTGALAGYQAAPSSENLRRAVLAIRTADRSMANPGAPCLLEEADRVDYLACFEIRRWTSSLVAQHMLRYGLDVSLGSDVHDAWWDVGNAARKSRVDQSHPIANPVENWVAWMFLGWSFDPSRHPSVYTGGGFRQMALIRHATFIALRSQVARVRNSPQTYDDLVQAIRFSPNHWTTNVATFAYRHLLERLALGDKPTRPEQITEAIAEVRTSLVEALRKAPVADRARLQVLATQVIVELGG